MNENEQRKQERAQRMLQELRERMMYEAEGGDRARAMREAQTTKEQGRARVSRRLMWLRWVLGAVAASGAASGLLR